MCNECNMSICPSRCPNAHESEPEVFARCDSCNAKIYDGEEYYKLNGFCFCEYCVEGAHKTAEVDY